MKVKCDFCHIPYESKKLLIKNYCLECAVEKIDYAL